MLSVGIYSHYRRYGQARAGAARIAINQLVGQFMQNAGCHVHAYATRLLTERDESRGWGRWIRVRITTQATRSSSSCGTSPGVCAGSPTETDTRRRPTRPSKSPAQRRLASLQRLEFLGDLGHRFLRVAEQHAGALAVEERVVDAGEAGVH